MKNGKQIEIIQIMRLFGAFLIVIFHANLIGNHGYFGVDVFSVISGYIIMYSTEKPSARENFLLKRLIRIVPLYWLMTALNYAIISVLPQLSIMSEAKPEYLIKSMLFIPFVNGKGYNTPILGLGWTLNYEVMFYAVFFLAIHISHRWRGLIAALILSAAAAAGMLMEFDQLFLDYYTDSFVLEFLWGILAFYLIRLWEKYGGGKPWKKTCFAVGMMCFVYMFFDSPESAVPRCFRLGIPAFLFFCMMMLACKEMRFDRKAVTLGGMTYSIYLVEYFTTAAYKVAVSRYGMAVRLLAIVPLLTVTVCCAYVSHLAVERRLTGFLKRIFGIAG